MGIRMKPAARPAGWMVEGSIARDFGAATDTYESASRLQRWMGGRMLRRLPAYDATAEPLRILDLGCGTGYFARQLAGRFPGARVTGADLSTGMVEHARRVSGPGITWTIADAQSLPFPDGEFDVIFSNLMVQWCARPQRVFEECRRLLARGGVLQCSTLLDGSLRELAQAWSLADSGRRHVNRFQPAADVTALAHHRLPGATVETETLVLDYDSPLALARELQHLGAVYKGEDRRRTLTAPGRVRAMSGHYPRKPCGGISASYEACWISYGK